MRRASIVMLALSCGVSSGRTAADSGPLDFTLGGIAFHISDGAAVSSAGALTFYLSDQPNACAAFQHVPVGTATTFALQVAAQADGTTRATVVAKPSPAAGEATGGLTRATGGVKNASLQAASGTVQWTANADGSFTIVAIDVGFAGTADRMTTGGLTLQPCAP